VSRAGWAEVRTTRCGGAGAAWLPGRRTDGVRSTATPYIRYAGAGGGWGGATAPRRLCVLRVTSHATTPARPRPPSRQPAAGPGLPKPGPSGRPATVLVDHASTSATCHRTAHPLRRRTARHVSRRLGASVAADWPSSGAGFRLPGPGPGPEAGPEAAVLRRWSGHLAPTDDVSEARAVGAGSPNHPEDGGRRRPRTREARTVGSTSDRSG
jgi:hypothetical protein